MSNLFVDYFENNYRDSAKLTVVNKAHSSHGKSASTYYDDFEEDVEELPAIGQTMVIQMDDGGYRMLERIPEVDEYQLSTSLYPLPSLS